MALPRGKPGSARPMFGVDRKSSLQLSLATQLMSTLGELCGLIVLGWWLDRRWATFPIISLSGFLLGVTLTAYQIRHVVRTASKEWKPPSRTSSGESRTTDAGTEPGSGSGRDLDGKNESTDSF